MGRVSKGSGWNPEKPGGGRELKGKPSAIVAGVDISFSKHSAFAGAVLLEFPAMNVAFTLADELTFPYIPGLLSFREAPILLFRKVPRSRT